MTRRSGRCLCGAVSYTVDGPLRDVIVCHCAECRRWAGGPWPATAAHAEQLHVSGGARLRWRPSPASATSAERATCRECGSGLFWRAPGRPTVSIGVGTLDDASGLDLAAHIYATSAQAWETLGGAPVYPGSYPASAAAPAWR